MDSSQYNDALLASIDRVTRQPTAIEKVTDIHHGAPQVWDQIKGENARQFAAFALYRDLGPTRSKKLVAEESGYSRARLEDIASKYRWNERALAYDRELDRMRQAATKLETFNMASRQARLGLKMQTLAEKRIDRYAGSPELQESLTPNDVVRLASEGVRIERLAEGETTGDEGQPIIFAIGGLTKLPKWAPTILTGGKEANGDQIQEGASPTTGDIPRP